MFVLMLSYFIRVMDSNSSLGKICLGEDVVVISSDKVEGSKDWNSPEFQDTTNSGQKKAMVFYQMDTEEVSDRFVDPCFVNELEAYDGEINLGVEENMISNEYAFIINPEEDDVEPEVIFGRSFLRLTKAITDFGTGTVTIYLDIDLFLEEKSNDDWDHLLDFNIDDIPMLGEEGLPPFVCKMGKKEERPIIETMAYHDKYKKILDEVWKDKVELDGKIIKDEEEAIKRIKGEALKEKDDPRAFIFPIRLEGQVNENALANTGSDINTMPYRIYQQLGREDMKKVDRGITMINHTQAEAMGILTNVLCQVGVTTLIAKFLIFDILIDRDSPIVVGRGFLRTIGGIVNTPERLFSTFDGFCHQTFCAARSDVMRNAESDSDDEKDYQIQRNKFGAPIYGPKPALYLNCNDPDERPLAIQTVINPFRKISVWKKAVSFLGSLPVPLKQVNWKPDYKGSYTKEEEATGKWQAEIRLTDPLREAGSDEEIFTLVAWIRAFNINEPIYAEVYHEFYSTYEFDEVCADDELQTKKIIKFRLGGRAHSLTLFEVARRLGLYQAVELEEEGFNVYFEGGLHSDDNFNAQDYWLSIGREENHVLSRSHTSTIRNPILRVIYKMIIYGLCQRTTGYDKIQMNNLWLLSMFDARHQNRYANVAWVIARWMKRKGARTQKESQICCGQFISKIARKCRVLTEDVVRSLSTLSYCRDLDTITLRGLIESEGKLIPEDPQSGVPKVGITRPQRASMQDLYDRMGRMEVRQEAIEQMEYRQSYH
ncbi:ribonuclease H-like domain-containing protein [Tanacetum coccineum]